MGIELRILNIHCSIENVKDHVTGRYSMQKDFDKHITQKSSLFTTSFYFS